MYEARYDRSARAWNVVEIATGRIVNMLGGGKRGEERAKRSADLSNRLTEAWGA